MSLRSRIRGGQDYLTVKVATAAQFLTLRLMPIGSTHVGCNDSDGPGHAPRYLDVRCYFMMGAIIGDIVGSVYEVVPTKSKEFDLFPKGSGFTDDTVHTIAIADSIVSNCDPVDKLHEYFDRYPHAGYGKLFGSWAKVKDRDP